MFVFLKYVRPLECLFNQVYTYGKNFIKMLYFLNFSDYLYDHFVSLAILVNFLTAHVFEGGF